MGWLLFGIDGIPVVVVGLLVCWLKLKDRGL